MILSHLPLIIQPSVHLCASLVGESVSITDGECSLDLGSLTITKIQAVIDFNNSDADIEVELEKDEVTQLTITIPAGQVGVFEATGTTTTTSPEKVCLDIDSSNVTSGHISIKHLLTYCS